MSQLLYLKVLEGYTYQLVSCTFISNVVSNTPVLVIDNSSISKVATPSSVNFLIEDTSFTTNIASSHGGSFKIMNNEWLYAQISGVTMMSNSYLNHYIGTIYKIEFSSCTYTNLDLLANSAVVASVIYKQFSYILGK